MSVQHIWNYLIYWGYLLAVNLQISLGTSSLRSATTRRRLCCEKLGTSHDVKGFAIGSFLERIVVERANDDLCWKNVKNAGLISVKPPISSEICPENNHKIGRFLPTACQRSLPLKFPRNFCEIGRFFREFCPQKSREIWLFFRDDQEPWFRMNKDWLTWSLPTCPSPDRGGQSVSSSHKNQCTSRSTVEWLQEKERYRLCYIHLMFQVQKAQLAKQRSKRTHPKLPSLQNHRLV